MAAKTITIDQLITEYAQPLGDTAELQVSDYEPTASGLASLLRDAADCLSPMDQTRDWLEEAADGLDAIAHLGDSGTKTQRLLKRIDATLYEAKSDLVPDTTGYCEPLEELELL